MGNAKSERPHLSLKWRLLALTVAVLGAVYLVVSVRNHWSQRQEHEAVVARRMDELRNALSNLAALKAGEMGIIATQLAANVDSRSLSGAGHSAVPQLTPDLQAALSKVDYFDRGGRHLAGWSSQARTPFEIETDVGYARRVAAARMPVQVTDCDSECEIEAFVPAFDRNGVEIVAAAARPLAELLVQFSQLTGADAALLASDDEPSVRNTGSVERIGGSVVAVSNAPKWAQTMRALSEPSLEHLLKRTVITNIELQNRQLVLLRTPLLAASGSGGIDGLVILDDTEALSALNLSLKRRLAIDLGVLVAMLGTLLLLLTPRLRRLETVTEALSLLAEQDFGGARAFLERRSPQRWLTDEIDILMVRAAQLARKLEDSRNAEAENAAKSHFLAVMSHEIRTPMNGVLGVLELLSSGRLEQPQRDLVRIARESANALLRVIDDILDFSKIEAGQVELELAPFDVAEVVEGTAETFAPVLRGKPVHMNMFVDPDIHGLVMGDAGRLRQVLFNLCGNAAKFTQRGNIEVRATCMNTGAGQVRVRFSVRDTGIGIGEQARQRLFKPFVQADSSTTRKFGGTGLGLSISQGLLRCMGSKLELASKEGEGSEFWFELAFEKAADSVTASKLVPDGTSAVLQVADSSLRGTLECYLRSAGVAVVAEQDMESAGLVIREGFGADADVAGITIWRDSDPVECLPLPVRRRALEEAVARAKDGRQSAWPAQSTPAESAKAGNHATVLVAEDHPINQQVIARQLAQLGYTCIIVCDGVEALQTLDRGHVDLLLTDLHMPGLDGFGLAEEIRRREREGIRAGHLPILALSAAMLSGEKDRCRDSGMDDFLTKPIALHNLRESLKRWLVAVPSKEPEPECPLDLAILREVAGGDNEFINHMLGEFLRINHPLHQNLAGMAATDLARQAHRLLGSARTIGASALASALTALEAAANCNDAGACKLALEAVGDEFVHVARYINGRRV